MSDEKAKPPGYKDIPAICSMGLSGAFVATGDPNAVPEFIAKVPPAARSLCKAIASGLGKVLRSTPTVKAK